VSELFNRLLDESFNAPRRPAPRPDEIVDTDKIGPASLGETFGRGVTVGIEGLKTDVEYFKGIFNTLTGNEEAAAANIRKARVRESFIPDYLSGIESFGEFLDNPTFDGFVTQAFKAGGQVLPSAITSIAGAGTGALVAGLGRGLITAGNRAAANRLLRDTVQRNIKGIATADEKALLEQAFAKLKKDAGAGLLRRDVGRGAIGGAFAAEYPPLAGSAFSEALDSGRDPDRSQAFRALGVAAPQAAVGVGGEVALVKLFGKVAKSRATEGGSWYGKLAKDINKGILGGGAVEAATETVQESIAIANRRAMDDEFTAQEGQLRLAEAAFAGFFGGAGIGGAGGTVGGVISAVNSNDVMSKASSFLRQGQDQIVSDQITEQQYGPMGTAIPTVESDRSIKAQLKAMFDRTSSKQAVFIPGATPVQNANKNGDVEAAVIDGNEAYTAFIKGKGTIVTTSKQLAEEVVKAGASDTALKEALGYSAVPETLDPQSIVIQALDGEGNVVSEEVTSEENKDNAVEAARNLMPKGGRVAETTYEKALEARQELVTEENKPTQGEFNFDVEPEQGQLDFGETETRDDLDQATLTLLQDEITKLRAEDQKIRRENPESVVNGETTASENLRAIRNVLVEEELVGSFFIKQIDTQLEQMTGRSSTPNVNETAEGGAVIAEIDGSLDQRENIGDVSEQSLLNTDPSEGKAFLREIASRRKDKKFKARATSKVFDSLKKARKEYLELFDFPDNYFEVNDFAQSIPAAALKAAIAAKKQNPAANIAIIPATSAPNIDGAVSRLKDQDGTDLLQVVEYADNIIEYQVSFPLRDKKGNLLRDKDGKVIYKKETRRGTIEDALADVFESAQEGRFAEESGFEMAAVDENGNVGDFKPINLIAITALGARLLSDAAFKSGVRGNLSNRFSVRASFTQGLSEFLSNGYEIRHRDIPDIFGMSDGTYSPDNPDAISGSLVFKMFRSPSTPNINKVKPVINNRTGEQISDSPLVWTSKGKSYSIKYILSPETTTQNQAEQDARNEIAYTNAVLMRVLQNERNPDGSLGTGRTDYTDGTNNTDYRGNLILDGEKIAEDFGEEAIDAAEAEIENEYFFGEYEQAASRVALEQTVDEEGNTVTVSGVVEDPDVVESETAIQEINTQEELRQAKIGMAQDTAVNRPEDPVESTPQGRREAAQAAKRVDERKAKLNSEENKILDNLRKENAEEGTARAEAIVNNAEEQIRNKKKQNQGKFANTKLDNTKVYGFKSRATQEVAKFINFALDAAGLKNAPIIFSLTELKAMLAEGLDLEQNFSQQMVQDVNRALVDFESKPTLRGRLIKDNNIKDGNVNSIAIIDDTKGTPTTEANAKNLEHMLTASHEIGHALFKNIIDDLKKDSNKEIYNRLFENFKKSGQPYTILKDLYPNNPDLQFEEYFADQVSKWASKQFKNKKPKNIVEKTYKNIVARMERYYRALRKAGSRKLRRIGDTPIDADFEIFITNVMETRRASGGTNNFVRDTVINAIVERSKKSGRSQANVEKVVNIAEKVLGKKPNKATRKGQLEFSRQQTGFRNPSKKQIAEREAKKQAELDAVKDKPSQPTTEPNKLKQAVREAAGLRNKIVESRGVKALGSMLQTADSYLRTLGGAKYGATLNRIADFFYIRAQQGRKDYTPEGRSLGFVGDVGRARDYWQEELKKALGTEGKPITDLRDPEIKAGIERAQSSIPTESMDKKSVEYKVRKFLEKFYEDYIGPNNKENASIEMLKNYFPTVLDLEGIAVEPDGFVEIVLRKNIEAKKLTDEMEINRERVRIKKVVLSLLRRHDMLQDDVEGTPMPDKTVEEKKVDPLQYTERELKFTKNVGLSELQGTPYIKDPTDSLLEYLHSTIKRVEWNAYTKDAAGNDLLGPELDKLPPEMRAKAFDVIHTYLGYQNEPLSPLWRKVNSYGQFLQIITILPFAAIASIPELAGPLIVSKDFAAFKAGFVELFNSIKNYKEAETLARDLAVITNETVATAWMTQAELDYMDPKVREWTDVFFKITGLNFFTRFTRIFASNMGVNFIIRHSDPATQNENSLRYLNELGLTPDEVKAWVKGGREFTSPVGKKVRAGLQRFVESSILRPNAAERPVWASDPRWALIWQLKSFFYAYGKVILGGGKREFKARLANADKMPYQRMTEAGALVLLAGLAVFPLAMFGLELREYAKNGLAWILPGVESGDKYFRSDRMSWSEYSGEIIDRSGVLGPFTLLNMMHQQAEWGKSPIIPLLGPTAETIDTALTNGFNVGKTFGDRLLPFYNVI
tara:strand:+ start:5113 stop:11940 length:6828 start_codon:yes stop_codon:yes gene_type:complete